MNGRAKEEKRTGTVLAFENEVDLIQIWLFHFEVPLVACFERVCKENNF